MKTIDLAPGLALPTDEAASQKYAFIGRSGSGKTYAAGKLVELLIGAGSQVVIVDPVGVWFGLRLASDGKSAGLQIPIFGGQRGDIPLEPTAGAVVADLVASRQASLVLDVSEMTGGEQRRFVADFAESLLRAKKRNRSSVLIVWEESQEFCPERVFKDSARMVGAMQRLVKIGRNFGVGTALLTQRPQAVSKEILNQTETLFVFQTTGPHERKAVEGWIVEHAIDLKKFVDELPALDRGTGYAWSPQWLRKFLKVRVRAKLTFDASSTPTGQRSSRAIELAPIDLEKIQEAMAATVQRVKESDPRELRKRIAELERQVQEKPPIEARIVERVEVPVLKNEQLLRLESATSAIASAGDALAMAAQEIHETIKKIAGSKAINANHILPSPKPAQHREVNGTADNSVGTGGLRRILVALAQRPGRGLTNRQIGLRAGLSSGSGTFSTYLSRARAAGWIADNGDVRLITEIGLNALWETTSLCRRAKNCCNTG